MVAVTDAELVFREVVSASQEDVMDGVDVLSSKPIRIRENLREAV
ncbi:hypothetical protein [uncultured Aquimarina sp.]|nr:hypothetical protein [uncultured Aquimarina sp.]